MCYDRAYILLKDNLKQDVSNWIACLAGGHVLQEDMSCRRLCLTCGYLLLKDMSFMGTCLNPMHLVQI